MSDLETLCSLLSSHASFHLWPPTSPSSSVPAREGTRHLITQFLSFTWLLLGKVYLAYAAMCLSKIRNCDSLTFYCSISYEFPDVLIRRPEKTGQ